jgi:hypothetical protein
MTRFELADAALGVLQGKYGNGPERKARLGVDYSAVQAVVDCILKFEDNISKEIAKKEEELSKLKAMKAQEDARRGKA